MRRSEVPEIMGILNVTPDSFSDGGEFQEIESAIEHAQAMASEGAAIIDVGGESTRPGSQPISEEEELRRVLPVVTELAALGIFVSVDTSKAAVAAKCLEAGARMINDVTALAAPAMAELCAGSGCRVCLMHMQGTPVTMQINPAYENVVSEVRDFLLGRADAAIQAGVKEKNIVIDPGIGFGKTELHNLTLIKNIGVFVETGFPVLLGVSRKGFIGRVTGAGSPVPVNERVAGTLAIHSYAQERGVSIFRTHDVGETLKAARMIQAILV